MAAKETVVMAMATAMATKIAKVTVGCGGNGGHHLPALIYGFFMGSKNISRHERILQG